MLAVGLLVGLASPAHAFEYFDGRLQVHGFFEEQVRALSNNFDAADDLDLAAWQHVLNIETEYDFAPDGWGPFDVLSGFLRLEARYDCVWTRACGIFPSADAFGNRANHLPGVKTSGRASGFTGSIFVGDTASGPFNERRETARFLEERSEPTEDGRAVAGQPLAFPTIALKQPRNSRKPARPDQVPGLSGLFDVRGPNAEFERGGDDPAFFVFSQQMDCKFGIRAFPGGVNGVGNHIIGPINPKCDANERGGLAGKPNPFGSQDFNPVLSDPSLGIPPFGSAELPARRAAEFPLGTLNGGGGTRSTGIFLPSRGFQRAQRSRNLDSPRQNFSEGQLAWNRGDSQGWERELKEAYFDMEFFDSQLWIRAGRQSIVWGKTELFRTTDQFNPVDLALASLPSLEEARIALWSVRGVWSFYNVGPAEDVRLEVALNFDQFKPSDIGQCGEPFTALVACNKRLGLWVHGLTGYGLAGEDRPDSPWQDIEGLEFGARVEFRLGRFSFQISDFLGYDDLPYADIIQTFERRVDSATGRPIRASTRGSCTTGQEDACLPIRSNLSLNGRADDPAFVANGANARAGLVLPGQGIVPNTSPESLATDRRDIIDEFGSNLQLFSMICATSIGFNGADLTACGQSVFNSPNNAFTATTNPTPIPRSDAKTFVFPTVASLLTNALVGNPVAGITVQVGFTNGVNPPFVPITNRDPCDGFFSLGDGNCTNGAVGPVVAARTPVNVFTSLGPTLNQVLTDEQEALLGCGPFWGTDCEADGIDLLNADAGVLMQSWVGFPGSYTPEFIESGYANWHAGNGEAQPGTIGFAQNGSSLPATRVVDGRVVQVPGTRSPFLPDGVTPNPDYNVNQDGSIAGLTIPPEFLASAGQQFVSEMAALSFNYQMLLVAFSSRARDALTSENNEFDFSNPFAFFDPSDPTTEPNRGKCSFLQPQFCSAIGSLYDITGAHRNSVRAGGNEGFGRWDFIWHSGGEAILRYTKRNVLGFSFDFAEDITKSNWGTELTWISRQRFSNNDRMDGVKESGTINLTISVDRPTFINFLNQNRTFFFNSQWFFQYITDYDKGFTSNGPYNILGTFTIQTGYFQDRLLPGVTFVYDRRSNSGAALTSIGYRFTENFSGTVGMNFFWGRFQTTDIPIQGLGTVGNQAGRGAYTQGVENGLAVVRERDEFFMRLRYTF
ncbi:hypothetical protein KJ059_11120 [Myxococcota bacterium]|nr:hypothetical protein [Myxococcota bacterium]